MKAASSIKIDDCVFVYMYNQAFQEGIIASGRAISDAYGTQNSNSVLVRITHLVEPQNSLRCETIINNTPLERGDLYIQRDDGVRLRDSALNISNHQDVITQIWTDHLANTVQL